MIPIHGVGEFARFCARQRIAHVAIGVEREAADKRSQLVRNPMWQLHTNLDTSLRCDEYRNS